MTQPCALCYGDRWIQDRPEDFYKCSPTEKKRFNARVEFGGNTGRMACPRCQPQWMPPEKPMPWHSMVEGPFWKRERIRWFGLTARESMENTRTLEVMRARAVLRQAQDDTEDDEKLEARGFGGLVEPKGRA